MDPNLFLKLKLAPPNGSDSIIIYDKNLFSHIVTYGTYVDISLVTCIILYERYVDYE